jgi:predicted nucleic acid-binding protein
MSLQFLDTNVLLYAYDPSAGERYLRACSLVDRLAGNHEAAISIQVMQEFYVNACYKVEQSTTSSKALDRLLTYSRWYVHSPLPSDVAQAVRLSERYQLSFWDSMIVQSALRLECEILWTEDLNHGQVIDSLQIRNPFSAR